MFKKSVFCFLFFVCVGLLFYYFNPKIFKRAADHLPEVKNYAKEDTASSSRQKEQEPLLEAKNYAKEGADPPSLEKEQGFSQGKAISSAPAESSERIDFNGQTLELSHLDDEEGQGIFSEQMMMEYEERAQKYGLPIRVYPFYEHARNIYKKIEEHGYQRTKLYPFFGRVVLRSVTLMPEDYKKATKTMEFYNLFEKKQKEAIENRIGLRLKQNPNDVPALLMQLDLHGSQNLIEQLFDDIEKIIIALDEYEPKALDKRAILFYAMDNGDFYAYKTEKFITELKARKEERLTLMSVPLLYFLEEAGDW